MRHAPAAVTALLLASLLPAAPAAGALRTRPCPGVSGARCATLRVPLDRTGAEPGSVALRVALEGRRRGRTLMYLSGGPGGAGIKEMRAQLGVVPELRRRFRLVGFDQRGTGRSGLLRCPALERDVRLRSRRAAGRCARRLGPARRHYTTPDSVADMEAIRRAVGARRLTLFGVSYGTELALAYARAHPERVARLILDSVVDPDEADPFALASFRAVAPSLRALCPARCRGVSAHPAADLARLVAKVRARPGIGVAYDPRGRPHVLRIGPEALLDLLFDADYEPQLRAALPAAVRAALTGDFAPVARLVRLGRLLAEVGSPRDFSSARFAAICEETPLPWAPGTPPGRRVSAARRAATALGAAAFFPFDPQVASEDVIGLCLDWPDVPRPQPVIAPGGYPAVPTLILQGGEDLRTPPEVSARIAARIPGAHRVVVPGVGHAVVGADPSDCGARALLRFVAGRAVPDACPRVPTGVPGGPAAPARFAALRTVPGLPPRVGRTVSGAFVTVRDLALALSLALVEDAGGGLRGGTWSAGPDALVVSGYRAVPGMRISARIGGSGRGITVRVGGSRAAHGVLHLTRRRIRGRLGGRRVDVPVRVLRAGAAVLARSGARAAAARVPGPVPRG